MNSKDFFMDKFWAVRLERNPSIFLACFRSYDGPM